MLASLGFDLILRGVSLFPSWVRSGERTAIGLERVRIAREESLRVSDMVCRDEQDELPRPPHGVRNRDVVARHRLHTTKLGLTRGDE